MRVCLILILIMTMPSSFACEQGVTAFSKVLNIFMKREAKPPKATTVSDEMVATTGKIHRLRFHKDDVMENVLLKNRKRGARLEELAKKEYDMDLKLTMSQKRALARIKSEPTTKEIKRAKSWNSKPSMVESVPLSVYQRQVEAMRKAGITDPDVQVLALKSGLLGFPPRKGIIDNFSTLFKRTGASHEREALAQTMSASDIFAVRFQGSVDEMVKSGSFRDNDLYQGNLDLWWAKTRISGKKSKSPIVKEYGEDSSREVWWPKRQIEATKGQSSQRFAAMDDMRIAINSKRVKLDDGRVINQEQSIEVIAKNRQTGEYEPFYYERVDGEWVARETFRIGSKEMPVNEACIKCHKGSNGKFIPLPKKPLVRDAEDLMDRGYTRQQAEDFYNAFMSNHH